MRMHLFGDLSGADLANCAGAATTAAATGWSLFGEAAMQLLGVPLPVALAALTGAFLARAYQAPASTAHAFVGSAAWVVGACALAPLAAPLAAKYEGMELPPAALAGAAFAIALGGPLVLQLGVGYVRAKFGAPAQTSAPAPAAGAAPAPSESKGPI